MKAAASTTNKGGGVAGKADRLGGAAGHAKYKCPICAQQAPDMKTMQARNLLKCSGSGLDSLGQRFWVYIPLKYLGRRPCRHSTCSSALVLGLPA